MLNIGDPAPQFSGTDILTGDSFTLSDHSNKIVLVAFHSTECPACQLGIPVLAELWNELRDDPCPIQIVGLSVHDQPNPVPALQFLGVEFPWLDDPAINSLYGVSMTPHYFFLKPGAEQKIYNIKLGLFNDTDPLAQKNAVRTLLKRYCRPSIPKIDRFWAAVVMILFGGTQDGGGFGVTPGGKPIHINPWDPTHLVSSKRDILLALAATELADHAGDKKWQDKISRDSLDRIEAAVKELRIEKEPPSIA